MFLVRSPLSVLSQVTASLAAEGFELEELASAGIEVGSAEMCHGDPRFKRESSPSMSLNAQAPHTESRHRWIDNLK